MSTSITTEISLTASAAQSKLTSLLSPSGIIGSSVGDILSVASDVSAVANTANSVLSDFVSIINDPIQVSFSQGQPYPGSFITTPTINLMPIQLAESALSSSTAALSLLACGQIEALAERVGFEILNDSGLAQAMASLFNEFSSITSLAFSIALDAECLCGCTEITPFTYPTNPAFVTCSIPSISPNPNIENINTFVISISGLFPNTVGIEGIVESVWVDGLSVSVNGSGVPISGIPQNINSGTYSDITGQANLLVPSITPVAIVDYSYQQNLLNVVLALSIDNGLSATVTQLMASPMATPVSFQVIQNRLNSVALRGDTTMLLTLLEILGANNVANKMSLLSALISAIEASDVPGAGGLLSLSNLTTIFQAGGITIPTSVTSRTLTQLISDVNAILTFLGITIQEVYSQSTCNSIFCSQPLLNVPLIKASNTLVLDALMGTATVQMANMFA